MEIELRAIIDDFSKAEGGRSSAEVKASRGRSSTEVNKREISDKIL